MHNISHRLTRTFWIEMKIVDSAHNRLAQDLLSPTPQDAVTVGGAPVIQQRKAMPATMPVHSRIVSDGADERRRGILPRIVWHETDSVILQRISGGSEGTSKIWTTKHNPGSIIEKNFSEMISG